jgi:hypothetical protein
MLFLFFAFVLKITKENASEAFDVQHGERTFILTQQKYYFLFISAKTSILFFTYINVFALF